MTARYGGGAESPIHPPAGPENERPNADRRVAVSVSQGTG